MAAEAAVAQLLVSLSHQILCRNWKTKVCEIDVISKKEGVVYFVEVKYRHQDAQGDGLEYVTTQKLKRMTFAAEVWCQQFGWTGDYRLMAAAVSGPDSENINLLEVA